MATPRIYADFHNADAQGRLRLNCIGTEEDLASQPENYTRVPGDRGARVVAHGRDPYFSGWTDTLQLNYLHAGCRAAMQDELLRVADRCDGVRCDMAMLLEPDIIERTWGARAHPSDGSPPVKAPFWLEAIARTRARWPRFLFAAEVYWDLEPLLEQRGFDLTYDKRLYDCLIHGDAESVRRLGVGGPCHDGSKSSHTLSIRRRSSSISAKVFSRSLKRDNMRVLLSDVGP